MWTPLAAVALLAVCAPCGSEAPYDLWALLMEGQRALSAVSQGVNAVRLNDTRVDLRRSVQFVTRQLVGAVGRLPDVLHPHQFVGAVIPLVVAVVLAALQLFPGLAVPAKMAALFLSVVSLYDRNWKVFDSYYLQNM